MFLTLRRNSVRCIVVVVALVITGARVDQAVGEHPGVVGRPYSIRSVLTAASLPGAILLEGGWQTTAGTLVPSPPLLMSRNAGETWEPVGLPPTQAATWSPGAAVVPAAITRRPDESQPVRVFYADPDLGVLYRTGDNGRTWAAFTFDLLPDCYQPFSIEIQGVQSDSNRLYALYRCIVWEMWPFGEQPAGGKIYGLNRAYYASDDAGLSWHRTSPVFDGTVNGDRLSPEPSDLFWRPSPADAQRLYAYGEFGWSVSRDGGSTWGYLTGIGLSAGALVTTAADAERLYLYQFQDSTSFPNPALLAQRSSDGGQTWDEVTLPPCGEGASRLVASQVRIGVLALACGEVLYTSLDDGATWSQRGAVPPSEDGTVPLPVELSADTSGRDRVLVPRLGVLYALDFGAGQLQTLVMPRQYSSYLPVLQR